MRPGRKPSPAFPHGRLSRTLPRGGAVAAAEVTEGRVGVSGGAGPAGSDGGQRAPAEAGRGAGGEVRGGAAGGVSGQRVPALLLLGRRAAAVVARGGGRARRLGSS